MDDLMRRLRQVFRRDSALGLGYGVTSLMAAVNVRGAGDPEQRRKLSAELRSGGRAAVGFHELGHGNDFTRNDCQARVAKGGIILNGRKDVINNVEQAGSLLSFARTDGQPGARLTKDCLVLQPAECIPAASEETFERAGRYTVLLAVAACVGTWLYSPQNLGMERLHIALIRLAARLRRSAADDLPEQEMEVLFADLVRRSEHSLSYCLDSAPVFS
jgi:hypothetical protein